MLYVVSIVALIALLFYRECSPPKENTANSVRLQQVLDSLSKRNDSVQRELGKSTALIDSLRRADSTIASRIRGVQGSIRDLQKQLDSSRKFIATLSGDQLVNFLNKRYPKDTTSQLLLVAKPVLAEVTTEAIQFHQTKALVSKQDSIINLQDIRIKLLDTTVKAFAPREKLLTELIQNKDLEARKVREENATLQNENKDLKSKLDWHKMGNFILIGSLLFAILR